jgi:hypothetical protein
MKCDEKWFLESGAVAVLLDEFLLERCSIGWKSGPRRFSSGYKSRELFDDISSSLSSSQAPVLGFIRVSAKWEEGRM